VPPPEKLAAFLRAASTLNVDLVGGVVLDQLGEESWQVGGWLRWDGRTEGMGAGFYFPS
jgi:hypothetical protein